MKQSLKSLNENLKNRNILFLHLQGIVLIPILNTLFNSEINSFLSNKKEFSINDIIKKISSLNIGYLHVALRVLTSSGLLDYKFVKNEKDSLYSQTKELAEITTYKKEINIFNIDTKLVELSEEVMESLKINFERFGLDLIDFYIQGLSILSSIDLILFFFFCV